MNTPREPMEEDGESGLKSEEERMRRIKMSGLASAVGHSRSQPPQRMQRKTLTKC